MSCGKKLQSPWIGKLNPENLISKRKVNFKLQVDMFCFNNTFVMKNKEVIEIELALKCKRNTTK